MFKILLLFLKISSIKKCNESNSLHESLKENDSKPEIMSNDSELRGEKKMEESINIASLENLQNLKFDSFKSALEISKLSKEKKIEKDLKSNNKILDTNLKFESKNFLSETALPDFNNIECLKHIEFDGFKSALQIIKTQEAERERKNAEELKIKIEDEKRDKDKRKMEKSTKKVENIFKGKVYEINSKTEKDDMKMEKSEIKRDKGSCKITNSEIKIEKTSKRQARDSLFDCEPRKSPKKKVEGFQSALQISKSTKFEDNNEKRLGKNSKQILKEEKNSSLKKATKSDNSNNKNYKKDVNIALHWKISEITKKNLQEYFPSPEIPDSDTFKLICRKMVHQLLAKRMSGENFL